METSKDKSAEINKEEILKKHVPADCIWEDGMNHLTNTPFKYVFAAMEEYASLSRLRELGEEKKQYFQKLYDGLVDEHGAITNAHGSHFSPQFIEGYSSCMRDVSLIIKDLEPLPSPPKEENV